MNGADPVNGATAGEAGNAMASSIESGAGGFRRGPSEPGAAFAFAVGGSGGDGDFFLPEFCLSLRAGDEWTDADSDGSPSPAVHVEIACTFQGADGLTTASGLLILDDTNPSMPGFDASTTFEDFDVLVEGTSSDYHITANGSDVNSGQVAGADAFELTHHEDQSTTSEALDDVGNVLYRVTEEYAWDMVLNVTGFQPGNDAPAGSLDVHGEWAAGVQNYLFEEDVETFSRTEVDTTSTLQLDPACPTNIVGGAVTATFDGDDGQSDIRITWTGCGTYEIRFNGTLVTS